MVDSIATILSVALGFGMLHALDADHVLTVTGISSHNNQWNKLLKYSLRWAFGHGFSLLFIGLSIFLLGFSFNSIFSQFAELIVAGILALIGCRILIVSVKSIWDFKFPINKKNLVGGRESKISSPSSNRAIFMGSLHGVAGTASVLAIIPITKISEPLVALGYLLSFSLGVVLSMFIFGGIFRHAMVGIFFRYPRGIIIVQVCIGVFAVIFSFKLMLSVF